MKKSYRSLMLTALLACTITTGCMAKGGGITTAALDAKTGADAGAKEDSGERPNQTAELEFFNCITNGEAAFNKVIEKFQTEYPNITVKQTAPADAETVLFTRISTGDAPDVMSVYPAETAYHTMMDSGVYLDLSKEEWLRRASGAALGYSQWNGKYYAMPYALNTFGIYCNKTMFKDAGLELPATWDELINCCETFKAEGITPMTFTDKNPGVLVQEAERVVGIIKNDFYKDCEIVGPTDASFTDGKLPYVKEMAEAILRTREYAGDTLAMGDEQCASDFANGKVPMWAGITSKYILIAQSNPDLDFTLIPYPNPVGGEQTLPINVDIAYGVSSASAHPDDAKKFIEFLSRPEVYQIIADEEGTPPVIEGVNYNIKPLKQIKDTIDHGKTFLTLVNFWPSGWRSEWSVYVQQLVADKNEDNLLKETDRICKEKYAAQ